MNWLYNQSIIKYKLIYYNTLFDAQNIWYMYLVLSLLSFISFFSFQFI
jgi:hypothetical protein